MEELYGKHAAFSQWLAIMLSALAFSGLLIAWDVPTTGYAVYDGDANLNAQPPSQESFLSSFVSGSLIILLMLAFHIAAYFVITRRIDRLD